jgi:hypothetical protein
MSGADVTQKTDSTDGRSIQSLFDADHHQPMMASGRNKTLVAHFRSRSPQRNFCRLTAKLSGADGTQRKAASA